MPSRAESLAALVGAVLLVVGIGAYSWRAAVIAAGVMLLLAAVARRRESR